MAYLLNSHRKFAAAAITASLVATAVVPAYAAPYTDVSNRYEEAVNYLVENQITNGITASDFGTSQTIKRADVAVMLAKALKLDLSKAPDSGFTDVPKRAKVYVDALKEAGIINGKTATSFSSDQEITRGEAAIMLTKAFKLTGDQSKNVFTDVSSRYAEAVAALVAHQITEGKTKTSFGTDQAITRGEFAIFLHKLAKLEETTVSVATVKNETELQEVLKNKDIKKIIMSESFEISSTIVITRNVEIDMDGQTLTGNLVYESTETADILLSSTKAGGKLVGTLTVNAPKADFIVGENVEITGAVTINNVKASTFYNKGVLHSVVIKDNDGVSFANKDNGIVLDDVSLNTTGKVSLIGNIGLVTVNQAAKVDIADKAAVKKMVVKVNGATVDFLKGKIDTIEVPQGITVKDSYGKLIETKNENTGSPGVITVAKVKNLDQLETALKNERIKTINLTQDIDGLNKQLIIDRKVTVNGKGFTLRFTDELNAAPANERSGILISSDKVKIANLKIEMPFETGWQGSYALQIYNSKEIVLDNFTGIGADAALLINGSAVELTGTTTVTNNEFGGIEVSKGSAENLSNSELTVTGAVVNEQEATGKPTIWMVDGQGAVKGENVPSHTSAIIKEGQVQYYVTKQPIDDFHEQMITRFGTSFYQLVDLDIRLDALEEPIQEVHEEWVALKKLLEGEDVVESNQSRLANTEENIISYLVNRIKRFTDQILSEDYSEASYVELESAKVIPAPSTFEEALEKVERVNGAASKLVFASQAEFDQTMEQARELKQEDYTADSFAELQNATSMDVPKTNAETVEKIRLINTAKSALVFAGQADLDQEIQKAESLFAEDHTSESFGKVQTALAISKPGSNAKVLDKTEQLKKALSQLVFAAQSDLDEAMKKANDLDKMEYTPASYQQVKDALALAKPSSNQEAIAKESAISKAVEKLVYESEPALNQTLASVDRLDPTQYTVESFAKLQRVAAYEKLTSNQSVKEKNEIIKQAMAELIFKNQADLDIVIQRGEAYTSDDYTVATFLDLEAALAITEPKTNAEVIAKRDAIEQAIRYLEFKAYASMAAQKAAASLIVKTHYAPAGIQVLETATAMPETTNAEMQAKAEAISVALANLKMLVEAVPILPAFNGGKVGEAWADPSQFLPYQIEVTLKDGSKKRIGVADWVDLDAYNAQVGGSYTFEAVLNLPANIEYGDSPIVVEVVVEQLPMSITSKPIPIFDFSTKDLTYAEIPSKLISPRSLMGQNKSFTIIMGEERIPILIDDVSIINAGSYPRLGDIVRKQVNDYYLLKYPGQNIELKKLFWVNSSGTDFIHLFAKSAGSNYTIQVEGKDWNYFFDKSYSQGISDNSRNKSITISDGTKTMAFNARENFRTVDAILWNFNNQFNLAGIQAKAVKVNDQQFKIVASKTGVKLEIGGPDKSYFFEN